MSNVKVIIISNTTWNLFNFRRSLMRILQNEGFNVLAVAPQDKYVTPLCKEGFTHIHLAMDNKGTNPFYDIIMIWRLYCLFRKERPDIVLTYTPKPNIYASIAAGIAGVSIIPNVSGLGNVFIRTGIVTVVIKWLYRFAMSFPKKVFFQNNDDMELFVQLGLVKENIAERIPGSGINTTIFMPQCVKHKEGKPFVFLLVARMLWDKGVGEFVQAAQILRQQNILVEFQLLGFLNVENPQAVARTQMEQWVEDGIVVYLGETDQVIDFMHAADCIVLPSYREGAPRTLLEAASLGKPIITTDAVGCRDVVDDGVTGYLCKLKDGNDLAHQMKRMLYLSESERLAMGAQGREKMIQEFDEKIVLDKYLSSIKTILKE
ncbi:MAG: glycosyltransferase family 4 protein [Mariprofundales bacterium]